MSLSRSTIIDGCLEVIERDGANALSLRKLGKHLGVDATAIYRHFSDKDDLLRGIGDRLHESILIDLPTRGSWRNIVKEICVRLRQAHLQRPDLAAFVRSGPPLHEQEFLLTETLLRHLARARLPPKDAALAYHGLIELTVASAAIDAPMASRTPQERHDIYARWRGIYASLDAQQYPASVAHAPHLYATTADDRFEFALERLLDGLEGLRQSEPGVSRQLTKPGRSRRRTNQDRPL